MRLARSPPPAKLSEYQDFLLTIDIDYLKEQLRALLVQ